VPVQFATPDDLQRLQQTQERQLRNPYRAGRSGNAAALGHTVSHVSPSIGDAILRGTSRVQNIADNVDIAGGRFLNRIGVPDTWTASEERLDLSKAPYGQPGVVQAKQIYVPRMSAPIARGASLAGLAALGAWTVNKLKGQPVQSDAALLEQAKRKGLQEQSDAALLEQKRLLDSQSQDDVRTASTMPLTHNTNLDSVDPSKLAAHVIDKQANLISELHATATKMAGYAAALAQAVTLAQDGLIDVSDIQDHARQLHASGEVKLSTANAVFEQSPGDLQGPASGASEEVKRLDPLTTFLRNA